jgi:hypothetical protein
VFATDLSVYPPVLFAFDANGGTVKWTYQQPADLLTLVAASDGGGLTAKSTTNGVDTVIDFDPSGTPTTDPLSGSGLSYMYSNLWLDPPPGAPLSGLVGNPVLFAVTPQPEPQNSVLGDLQMNVFQIAGTTVNSNDGIGSQIQKANKVWGNSIAALELVWNNSVTSTPVCDQNTLPLGYTCAGTPGAHLDNFDAPSGCKDTTGSLVLNTRWPNFPSSTNTGANIIFTNSITGDPNPFAYVVETVPSYDYSQCPGSGIAVGGIGHDVVMSNEAYNYTLAHAMGHVFGLRDQSGVAAADNPSNLMCSDTTSCPDQSTHGTFLTPAQVADRSSGPSSMAA